MPDQLRRSTAAFGAAFANRDLRLVLLAYAGGSIGQWAASVALTVYAFTEAGAGGVSLLIVAALVPGAVAAPFASTLADRHPRVRIMVASDAARAATAVAGAGLVAAGAPLALVLLASALRGIAASAFEPAKSALLPQLAGRPDELTATNVTSSTIESTSIFVGPAIGGVLVAATSVEAVLGLTAVTFAASALLIARVRPFAPPAGDERAEPAGMLREAAAGARAVATTPALRVLIGLLSAQVLLDGVLGVLLAVLALDLLGIGGSGLGWLNAALGVGGLIGAVVAAGLVGRRLSASFAAGCALWGLPLVLIGAAPEVAVAALAMGIIGLGNTLVDVSGFTLLQRAAPEDVIGRVFGVLESVLLTSVVAGALLAPVLVDLVGVEGALIVAGLLLPAVTTASWVALRRIDAEAPAAEAELALLRGVELFAPLGTFELERLARALHPVSAKTGDAVVTQGDAGDRFYVVEGGRVEVLVDGRPVREHGPGEGFGEIALLRDIPRTATVRALEPTLLRALERDDFLSAVTGAASAAAAESIVAARLAFARPAAARAG